LPTLSFLSSANSNLLHLILTSTASSYKCV
jgi:hypothetical protein